MFKYDKQNKSYEPEQEITLVTQNNVNMGGADIHILPDGKFLYASVRGETNKIFIYKILKDGKLRLQGSESTMGIGPRNFTLHPDGKFLLVAHQRSNSIIVFGINSKTGLLKNTGHQINLPSPVSLQWGR